MMARIPAVEVLMAKVVKDVVVLDAVALFL